MKKVAAVILFCMLLTGNFSCSNAEDPVQNSANTFPFTHYSSGGTEEIYYAHILFEQSNATFTSYQVAYLSCTCRDTMANFYSICYVELLNSRPMADSSAIRAISFGKNRGLWGDSNPNYYIAEYTEKYMDEHLVQPLVRATKEDFDAWKGYGSLLPQVEADAISGATVSSSNLISMLKGLFAYHVEHYYNE